MCRPGSRVKQLHVCELGLAQLQKGREFRERYTRASKLLDNKVTTAMIKSLGQIDFLK